VIRRVLSGLPFPKPEGELEPVHDRHREIGQYRGEGLLRRPVQADLAILGEDVIQAEAAKLSAGNGAVELIILDDQDWVIDSGDGFSFL